MNKPKLTVRRIIAVMTLVVSVTVMSGCWDMRDINERTYVMGIGIDPNGDSYSFTFCCSQPVSAASGDGGSSIKTSITTIESDSMSMALRKLEQSVAKQPNLEQLSCIAFGFQPTVFELHMLLDHALRDPLFRRQSTVVIAEPNALELLSTTPPEGTAPSSIAALLEAQDNSRRQSATPSLYRLGLQLDGENDFFLYRISRFEDSDAGSVPSDSDGSSAAYAISGLTSYTSDGVALKLDAENTELSRLFIDGQTSGIISVAHDDDEKQSGDADDVVYYEIKRSGCTTNCKIANGTPRFHITVYIECVLTDSGAVDRQTEDEIERSLHGQLSGIIEQCRRSSVSAPLGLENTARQCSWKWYNLRKDDWNRLFSDSTIELEVYCDLLEKQYR